jgi:hypothetical protein
MARKTIKNIILILTLTCDQASRLLSDAQDRSLNRPERWALSFHLLICRFCRKYKRQLKLLRDILTKIADQRTYDKQAPPLLDPETGQALRGRISKKIHESLDSM